MSDEPIVEARLLKLNFYILNLRYLKKEASYFIELANKDEHKNNQKPLIFDLKEKIKKNVTKNKK